MIQTTRLLYVFFLSYRLKASRKHSTWCVQCTHELSFAAQLSVYQRRNYLLQQHYICKLNLWLNADAGTNVADTYFHLSTHMVSGVEYRVAPGWWQNCGSSHLSSWKWVSSSHARVTTVPTAEALHVLLCVDTSITAVNELNRDVWTQCAAKWATTQGVFHHYTQWLWIKRSGENVCKSISMCSGASSGN